MRYELLSKIYYKNREKYQELYEKRFNSEDSVYHLPVKIKDNPAFIVNAGEITEFLSKIYIANNKLTRYYSSGIPKVAQRDIQHKYLIDEVSSSNDIESVYSSQQELNLVLKNPSRTRKFSGIVEKYRILINDKEVPLVSCENLRDVYNQLLIEDIDKKDVPDGYIFRKGPVSVYAPSGKIIHNGLASEKQLIEFTEELISWFNEKSEIPELIRLAAFHYCFAYAHPFYDGNGRFIRYISSFYMKNTLNVLAALRLSVSINRDKKLYYDSFDICNDLKNKGDITPFVITFLEFIYKAIEETLTDVGGNIDKLNHYGSFLECMKKNGVVTEKEESVLFILLQDTLFVSGEMEIDTLGEILGKGKPAIAKTLSHLIDLGFVSREKSGRTYFYYINLDEIEKQAQ